MNQFAIDHPDTYRRLVLFYDELENGENVPPERLVSQLTILIELADNTINLQEAREKTKAMEHSMVKHGEIKEFISMVRAFAEDKFGRAVDIPDYLPEEFFKDEDDEGEENEQR